MSNWEQMQHDEMQKWKRDRSARIQSTEPSRSEDIQFARDRALDEAADVARGVGSDEARRIARAILMLKQLPDTGVDEETIDRLGISHTVEPRCDCPDEEGH